MKAFISRVKAILLLLSGSIMLPAHAVYVESTIYDMAANKSFISKSIYNDSHTQNVYSISATKIDKPGAGGEHHEDIENGELLFTPLTFSLAPGAKEVFKIFYRGQDDEKERYYRILFRETPITLIPMRNSGKKSAISPAIALETILVVRPRKMRFDFALNEKEGTLKNTGNTFFRVIIHKGCHSSDDEASIFYLLPGEGFSSPTLKMQNKKFIVALQRYIPMGKGCFSTDNEG